MDGTIVNEPNKGPVYFNTDASCSGTKAEDMVLPKMPPLMPANDNPQYLMHNNGFKTPPPNDNRGYSEVPTGYHLANNYSKGMGTEPRVTVVLVHNPTPMRHVQQNTGYTPNDWANQIANVIQNPFGLKPKEQAYMYKCPYPDWFDKVPLSPRYRITNFSKFSGHDDVSTIEHISRFTVQLGEIAGDKPLKVRLFPLSLSSLLHYRQFLFSLGPTWRSSSTNTSLLGCMQ